MKQKPLQIRLLDYAIPPPPAPLSQKFRVHFSLTVFLKYDQLDVFKASDSISDYLTLIFPIFSDIFAWVTQPECPKDAQDEVKRPEGPTVRSRGPEGPQTSSSFIFPNVLFYCS